jgi:hypothetical protein
MIFIIPAIALLITAGFFAKKFFIKRLQRKYEESLLKGDKTKSIEVGKHYFLALDEATRKAKGVVDIEAKISDDFRAFNSQRFSILL